MTKFTFNVAKDLSENEIMRYQEIFVALIASGGLGGLKGGKTVIHFDHEGIFQGVQLDYWSWKRPKNS